MKASKPDGRKKKHNLKLSIFSEDASLQSFSPLILYLFVHFTITYKK